MTTTSLYSVVGQDGQELDSHFAIELIEGRTTVVYESRSAARGAENERNSAWTVTSSSARAILPLTWRLNRPRR